MADITDINVNGTSYNILDDEGMRYVSSPTNGDVLTTDANGQAVDSGVTLASLSGKQDALTAGDGIDITNGVISNVFEQLAGVDLNTVTYNYQGYVDSASTNKPTSTGGGFSAFFQHGSSVIHGFQLFNQYTTDDLYFRRYNNRTWGAWTRVATYYKAGETVTISNASENDIICNGFVTGSSKTIYFHLPLDKPVDASNVTFSSLYILPRGDQGYMNGSSMIDVCADSNYTVTAKPAQGGIKITVGKTTAFTVTNNTPVALQVRGRTFTFS